MYSHHRTYIRSTYCIYCGEIADTDEHWPPISFCLDGYVLSACKQCNSMARDVSPVDFIKRASYVNDRLRKKYRRQLETPEWSPDEEQELGYGLKGGIKAWQESVKIAKQRVAWNAIAYIASIDLNNDFVLERVDRGAIEKRLRHILRSWKGGWSLDSYM